MPRRLRQRADGADQRRFLRRFDARDHGQDYRRSEVGQKSVRRFAVRPQGVMCAKWAHEFEKGGGMSRCADDTGFISLPTNHMAPFTQVLRAICFAAVMNIAKVCTKALLKNMGLKCWFGMKNFQKLPMLS